MEVRKAAKAAPPPPEPQGARLLSAEETTALRARQEELEAAARQLFTGEGTSGRGRDEITADSVFAKLKSPRNDQD